MSDQRQDDPIQDMAEVQASQIEKDLEAGQPKGLWVLFITEMWERFSYYGMRALFVLFLIASADQFLPADLGIAKEDARQAAVMEVIAERLGVSAEEIELQTALEGELAFDEADAEAFVADLEREFETPYPAGASALADAETVGDLVSYATEEGQGEENVNPGFGWDYDNAYLLYGTYTFMVYLTSIFGGIVADRMLGTHRSMLIGGWIIALGHIALALMAFFPHELGTAVSADHGYSALLCFLIGCTLIIIGTGFFKPCVSVMVGQLYHENDPRRDSGFTIFYMGINLGAFFSPIVAGYLGEKIGWHYGFGSAAVGMLLGLFFYQAARGRYLGTIGDPPAGPMSTRSKRLVAGALAVLIGVPGVPLVLFMTGGLPWVLQRWDVFTGFMGVWGMAGLIVGLVVFGSLIFLFAQPGKDRGRLGVIFILAFVGNIFFWTAFEQAGSSMNVFAKEQTDRTLWGMIEGGFPASFYQSVNPLAILVFAPVFSWLWLALERRRRDPSTPVKFALGLWLLGLAFIAMVAAAWQARTSPDGLAGPHWLLITYVVYTWGELCLSPVGLSMVTKLAPARLQSLMMGLWFFTFALANLCGGLVARFSTKFVPEEPGAEAEMTFLGVEGLAGFYLMLVIFPICAGFLIFAMSPWIKKMMGGIR